MITFFYEPLKDLHVSDINSKINAKVEGFIAIWNSLAALAVS